MEHMPTCYRFGGFPREGSMRPRTVSLFGGGWEAGMWVCFLLGCCLPFKGIAKWYLGILSSGKAAALEVEAVLTLGFASALMRAMSMAPHCSWFTTHFWNPEPGEVVTQFVPAWFFLPGIGLDGTYTDRLEIALANASHSFSLRLWIPRGLKHLLLWCLGSVTTSPGYLGLSTGPFDSFHPCSLWGAPNSLNGEHLMMQMRTQDQIKGWGIPTTLNIN